MSTGASGFKTRIMLLEHLNLSMVMDHARGDADFLDQLIAKLEERGVDDRTDDENSLLEWARSIRQDQSKKID